ncbi:MAG: hypothetical protein INQ03_10015 [Candidatus Heimdallarchaeota archaeon]|nr:hypothetical protein [Candidatus Heimdallarchaeota archaeon]
MSWKTGLGSNWRLPWERKRSGFNYMVGAGLLFVILMQNYFGFVGTFIAIFLVLLLIYFLYLKPGPVIEEIDQSVNQEKIRRLQEQSMKCMSCRTPLDGQAQFCPECGFAVRK